MIRGLMIELHKSLLSSAECEIGKDMFDNHVLRYFCPKIPRYFDFRCLVMPYYGVFVSSKYIEIRYFKSKPPLSVFKIPSIRLFTKVLSKLHVCQICRNYFLIGLARESPIRSGLDGPSIVQTSDLFEGVHQLDRPEA